MFDEASFTAAEGQCDALLTLAGGADARILDLGCGPGRHAIPLAARGATVTGLDLSEHLLSQARAQATGVAVEWIRDDMRAFSRPGHFHLITCLWSSFGYFDDPADDLVVLKRCYDNLAPGGVLLLDVVGKEIVCRDLEPVHLTELADGALLIERPLLTNDMSVYSNEWTLVRNGQAHRACWHHQLYSGTEMKALLAEAGFDRVQLGADLEGAPYDYEAERLIAVGHRSAP